MDTRGPSSVSDHPSRRRVLALAGAGGAALAAGLLPQAVARAGHTPPGLDPDALHLGEDNDGTGVPTTLTDSIAEDHVLKVANTQGFGAILATSGEITGEVPLGGDTAILAISANGAAIRAVKLAAEEGAPAVAAEGGGVSPSILGFGSIIGFGNMREEDLPDGVPLGPGEGVVGMSEQPDKAGVLGESVYLVNRGFEGAPPPLGIGVMGRTGTGTGVIGEAFTNDPRPEYVDGTGVLGRSGQGTGVHGLSTTGIGVLASADTPAAALHVAGRAVFETAGTGVVPAGSNQAAVVTSFVGPDSQVIVTLTGNPGNRELRWVQMTPTGFTVHLSPAPPNGRPATPFAYVVLDRST